jgi:hypothetical protein
VAKRLGNTRAVCRACYVVRPKNWNAPIHRRLHARHHPTRGLSSPPSIMPPRQVATKRHQPSKAQTDYPRSRVASVRPWLAQ